MSGSQAIDNIKEISFGEFRFNFSSETLSNAQGAVELPPKPSKILSLLLKTPGELVTREKIIEQVWPDQVVDFDQNINFCIKQIREQLGDNPKQPTYVETVPKRGYRFLVKPEVISKTASEGIFGRRFKVLAGTAAAVIVGVVTVALWLGMVGDRNLAPEIAQDIKRGLYLLDEGGEKNRKLSQTLFESVLQQHPNTGQAHAGLVLVHLYHSTTQSQRDRVREHLKRALKAAPRDALTLLAKAKVAFYYDWDVVTASEAFRAAARKDPDSIMILHDLAVVEAIRGNMSLAEQSIERILEIDPGRFQQHYHAGWFYQVAGKYDLALKQCSESLELEPEHAFSLMCAGRSALKLQLPQTAVHYLSGFMKMVKEEESLINPIVTDIENGSIDSFNQWYVNWLSDNGQDPFMLALAYSEMGNTEGALAALENAIRNKHIMVPTALAFDELSKLRDNERFLELMQVVTR